MRINKFLASTGLGSRRKVEEYILAGYIKVNGQVVTNLGTEIDEKNDNVSFKDKNLTLQTDKVYIMLNKPKGYMCTVKDDRDRPTVLNLIKDKNRIYPVGRLDYNTEGLLLLTNDGDFANKIMHPSKKINKTYIATLKSKPKTEDLDKLRHGVMLEDGMTAPAVLGRPISVDGLFEVSITIHEGKNREVRRMFEAVGYRVYALRRIKIGELALGELPLKQYKYLTNDEIKQIFK